MSHGPRSYRRVGMPILVVVLVSAGSGGCEAPNPAYLRGAIGFDQGGDAGDGSDGLPLDAARSADAGMRPEDASVTPSIDGNINASMDASPLGPDVPAAHGLHAEYYLGTNFETRKLTRIDPTINFQWDDGSPDPIIPVDTFSARWTGQVQPAYSESYTFYLGTDDGGRLWINGQLVVDAWTDQVITDHTGVIALTAGKKYTMTVEYYERTQGAIVKLSWSSPSQVKEIVPNGRLYLP